MTNPDFLTVPEVAAALGLSPQRIRRLITDGRLPSTKRGRDHLILPADVERVRVRGPVGRPRQTREESAS